MKTSKLLTTDCLKLFRLLLYSSLIVMVFTPCSTAQQTIPLPVNKITVGKNADGRLEIFALCINDAVYHRWQITPNGNWSEWASLDGGGIKQIVVTNYPNGALGLFGLGTDGSIWQTWQDAPNGKWTDPWTLMHEGAKFKQIAVGKEANGALALFGIGLDDAVYGTWQLSPNGNWSQVTPLNGGGIKQITSTNYPNSALGVFGLGTNGLVYQAWQLAPNGNWTEGWTLMGSGSGVLKQIDVNNYPNGALGLFGLGTDGSVWQTRQVAPNDKWTDPWIKFLGGAKFKQIAIGKEANGALALFGIGLGDAVYGTWVKLNNNWSPVTPLNGGGIKQITSINYPNGALSVFGLGLDGLVYQAWQLAPNGAWTNGWTPMGSPELATTTKRISGMHHLDYFASPDPADRYSEENGVLNVTHNPGSQSCITGNEGHDIFFRKSKALPYGCKVERVDFVQFWPDCRVPQGFWGSTFSTGQYDANQTDFQRPYTTIFWHNECTGPFQALELHYKVSFIISIPVGQDIGENMFEPNLIGANEFKPPGGIRPSLVQPPAGYSWWQPSKDCPTKPNPNPNPNPNPCPTPQYFWFSGSSCTNIDGTPSDYKPCLKILACDLATAKAQAENANKGCKITQITEGEYNNGCK
jgi:hypothetical protein